MFPLLNFNNILKNTASVNTKSKIKGTANTRRNGIITYVEGILYNTALIFIPAPTLANTIKSPGLNVCSPNLFF